MGSGMRCAVSGLLVSFMSLMVLSNSCKKIDTYNPDLPTIGVYELIIIITQTSAVLPASVNTGGGNSLNVDFEYGTTTSYGKSESLKLNSASTHSHVLCSATLTDLSPGTTYHYRIKAKNDYGRFIGPDAEFTTLRNGEYSILFNSHLLYGTLYDISGNTYKTIQIGTQTWMAENLRVTRFNDSTPIPLVTNNDDWSNLTTPAYCWYDNDSSTYKMSNGALYNWFAVDKGKLCPSGWHVPSDLEWSSMIYSLGGNDVALSKLLVAGKAPGASNSSGFTALPCGSRSRFELSEQFDGIGHEGVWWSSVSYPTASDIAPTGAWELPIRYYLRYDELHTTLITLAFGSYKNGLSVRCLKD